jgi:hypothetical protein
MISRRLRVIGKQRDSDLRPRLAGREGLPITRYSHLGNDAVFCHLRASCERVGAGASHSSGRANVSLCQRSPRQSLPPMNSDYYCGFGGAKGRKLLASRQHAPNAFHHEGVDLTSPLPFAKVTVAAGVGLGTFRVCCTVCHPRTLTPERTRCRQTISVDLRHSTNFQLPRTEKQECYLARQQRCRWHCVLTAGQFAGISKNASPPSGWRKIIWRSMGGCPPTDRLRSGLSVRPDGRHARRPTSGVRVLREGRLRATRPKAVASPPEGGSRDGRLRRLDCAAANARKRPQTRSLGRPGRTEGWVARSCTTARYSSSVRSALAMLEKC